MTYHLTLAALVDPTRRAVLEELRRGPLAVGRLAERLPVTRPAVSQHLRILERAGLVRVERRGTRRLYHLEPRGFADLRAWMDRFST